jgi:hypothetical protein
MPARAGDNDKGYFENPDVVALNETLLTMDGYHWASLAYGTAIDFGCGALCRAPRLEPGASWRNGSAPA